jgi:hypothetical protein
MSKYFSIDGYWKDDKSEFSGNVVKEYDDAEEDEEADNSIFYYGMSEAEIQDAIANPDGNVLEFVITSYKLLSYE